MGVNYRVATLADVGDIVRLHKQSQPETFWAKMGGKSTRLFFSHFIENPKEHVLVAELDPHGVVGFILGTTRPFQYEGAFYKENVIKLLGSLIVDLVSKPSRIETLMNRISPSPQSPTPSPQSPNLPPVLPIDATPNSLAFAFLYVVDPIARGNRIGATILEKIAVEMGNAGYDWVRGRTMTDNIPAHISIARAGYHCVERTGDTLLYLYPCSELAKAEVADARSQS